MAAKKTAPVKHTLKSRQKKIRALEAEHRRVNAELNALRADQQTAMADMNVGRMRKASGELTDDRLLVTFLYMLLRDELPAGRVERIMLQLSNAHDFATNKIEASDLTNGWIGRYAQDIAERLLNNPVTWKKPL